MATTMYRRKSDIPMVGADCLDNRSLHFHSLLDKYDPSIDSDMHTVFKQEKDYCKKLKFSFKELESKRLFLEALSTISENGEGLPGPNDPHIQEMEDNNRNKKNQYNETKEKLNELQNSITEQITMVLQLHDQGLRLKEDYDRKWDEDTSNSNNKNNNSNMMEPFSQNTVPETQLSAVRHSNGYYDLMGQIIPETQQEEMGRDWNHVSRRLSFNDEEPFLSSQPQQQQNSLIEESMIQQQDDDGSVLEQMNSVLSWLNGVTIVQFNQTSNQIFYKLALSNIKSEDITVSIRLEKVVGQPLANNNNNRTVVWKLTAVQVGLPNLTIQRELNFDDIVQIGKRRNDVSFVVREITTRIEMYLAQHS